LKSELRIHERKDKGYRVAPLDKILFFIFLTTSILGLGWSWFAFSRAFRCANPRVDPDGVKMFMWACGGLVGLIFAGMSLAYVLFPIINCYFL
jgi:hypothetical protein